jgi:formate hydrogenlyase subunit 3/multisubunit Na+/H+ antiporter MnhD subunit
VYLLLIGAIGLPFTVGLCMLIVGRRLSPWLCRGITLALLLVATCCTAALSLYAGQDTGIVVEWLSGTGPMTLDLGLSGLYLLLATAAAACLASLASWPDPGRHAPQADGLVLAALAATGVTLLAGQFLLRYAALEIVALCVAFAPLAELRGRRAIWLTCFVYLLLRLGDVGLLVAIEALWMGSGTLVIGPALGAASQLPAATLYWVAAGMLLAVWVKVGGWPFQAWVHLGRQLPPRSRAWLYAVVLPNLGLYLLYRVTPLLAGSGPLRAVALWLGAGGATLAAVLALAQPGLDSALPYVMAAYGGLAVFAGGGGLAAAVWLSALALTPVRAALHLVTEWPSRNLARPISVGLGAILLCGWAACMTYWARSAGLPSAPTYLAELGVVLLVVCTVGAVRRSLSAMRAAERPAGPETPLARWVALVSLGLMVAASPLFLGLLRAPLLEASHASLPSGPSLLGMLRYVLTAPVAWAVAVLAVAMALSGMRLPALPAIMERWARDPGETLGSFARILRDAVEVSLLEGMLYRVVGAMVRGSRLVYRILEQDALEGGLRQAARAVVEVSDRVYALVEQDTLEGGLRQAARAVVEVSDRVYALVEQDTFEGGLRGVVRSTLRLARTLQGWHTGRLRRNLMWIAACAALAVLVLLLVW